MKQISILFALIQAAAASYGHALDLAPHFVTRITGNSSELIPYFVEGDTKYAMEMPRGVSASQDGGNVIFYFRNLDGSLIIKQSPFKPGDPFGGSTLGSYRNATLALVPPGATDAAVEQEMQNPLPFHDWTSYRITCRYKYPGRSFLLSATYLNFSPKQQILLVTIGVANDFAQIESLTGHLLGAWRQLLPGENLEAPPPM